MTLSPATYAGRGAMLLQPQFARPIRDGDCVRDRPFSVARDGIVKFALRFAGASIHTPKFTPTQGHRQCLSR